MCQLLVPDGILQRSGDMLLAHYGGEILRPVFPRGNHETVHGRKIVITRQLSEAKSRDCGIGRWQLADVWKS
jgi:hypothetical protein